MVGRRSGRIPVHVHHVPDARSADGHLNEDRLHEAGSARQRNRRAGRDGDGGVGPADPQMRLDQQERADQKRVEEAAHEQGSLNRRLRRVPARPHGHSPVAMACREAAPRPARLLRRPCPYGRRSCEYL